MTKTTCLLKSRCKINIQPDFFGNILLSFSAFLSALIFVVSLSKKHSNFGIKLVLANFATLIICCGYLFLQFLEDNFSFIYVFENSSSLLPTFYKISAFWSAHEGSFLLMILFLSGSMFINNSFFSGQDWMPISNATLAFILFFYLVFQIFTSNPFLIFDVLPNNGTDLNPLLQDPLLVIHPPVLFAGYVFYAVTFSLVIAGMFIGFDKKLFQSLKLWAGVSWFTLTFAILLGSIWAYYELGWGGYWFWDPVENVVLLPWLAGTAFTHSLIFSKNKILLSWMVFLGISTFLLTILASFVVRSGVLNSVHSFASDPSRGVFLLSLFGVFAFASLALFFSKSVFLQSEWPKLLSKQYLLVLNNVVLLAILLIVFLGTLYPIVTEVFYGQKLSIGPNYFSSLITPLVLILITLFSVEQFPNLLKNNKRNFLLGFLSIALVMIIIDFLKISALSVGLYFVALVLSILLFKALVELVTKRQINIAHKVLGHLSVVLLTFAVIANHQFSESLDVRLKPGEEVEFSNTVVRLDSVDVEGEMNFDTVVANFSIQSGETQSNLKSEKRVYKIGGIITSETGIISTVQRDYHIVLGDRFQDGSWSIRYSINYGIMLIWISSILLLFSMLYGTIRRHGY